MMSNTILFPKYPRTQDAKIQDHHHPLQSEKPFCHFVICHLPSEIPSLKIILLFCTKYTCFSKIFRIFAPK